MAKDNLKMIKQIEMDIYQKEKIKQEQKRSGLISQIQGIVEGHDPISQGILNLLLRQAKEINIKETNKAVYDSLLRFIDSMTRYKSDLHHSLEMFQAFQITADMAVTVDNISKIRSCLMLLSNLEDHPLKSRMNEEDQVKISKLEAHLDILNELVNREDVSKLLAAEDQSTQDKGSTTSSLINIKPKSNQFSHITDRESIVIMKAYVNEIKTLFKKYGDELESVQQVQLHPSHKEYLERIKNYLNKLKKLHETSSTSQKGNSPLVYIQILIAKSLLANEYVISLFDSNDAKIVKKGLYELFDLVLSFLLSTKEDATNRPVGSDGYKDYFVLSMAYFTISIIHHLAPTQQQQLSWRLQACLYSKFIITIPIAHIKPSSNFESSSSASMRFYSYLIACNSATFDTTTGWKWLVHASQILHELIEDLMTPETATDTLADNYCVLSESVSIFLNISHFSIHMTFSQQYIKLLSQLQVILQGFSAHLKDSSMAAKGIPD